MPILNIDERENICIMHIIDHATLCHNLPKKQPSYHHTNSLSIEDTLQHSRSTLLSLRQSLLRLKHEMQNLLAKHNIRPHVLTILMLCFVNFLFQLIRQPLRSNRLNPSPAQPCASCGIPSITDQTLEAYSSHPAPDPLCPYAALTHFSVLSTACLSMQAFNAVLSWPMKTAPCIIRS